MSEFNVEEVRAYAADLNHRGSLPSDMETRWDTQGAFIAGARYQFEKDQENKVSHLVLVPVYLISNIIGTILGAYLAHLAFLLFF
jgi:hypothetical protein